MGGKFPCPVGRGPLWRHRILLPVVWLLGGCFPHPSPDAEELRVVTYNIRHGRGMDERVDLERTARVLARIEPHLVGLQEVDHRAQRSGAVAQADSLAQLLGMQPYFAPFMPFQGGEYGMAILTTLPVVRDWAIELPPGGSEPRVALAVQVILPGGDTLVAVNVHFDWVRDDTFRFAQASALAATLDTLSHPWILVGDLNDIPDSRTLALFLERGVELAKPDHASFTFPSTDPVREIDYIFMAPGGGWEGGEIQVVDETVASDHRPIVATLHRRAAAH